LIARLDSMMAESRPWREIRPLSRAAAILRTRATKLKAIAAQTWDRRRPGEGIGCKRASPSGFATLAPRPSSVQPNAPAGVAGYPPETLLPQQEPAESGPPQHPSRDRPRKKRAPAARARQDAIGLSPVQQSCDGGTRTETIGLQLPANRDQAYGTFGFRTLTSAQRPRPLAGFWCAHLSVRSRPRK
jgi:hypothetical protein